MTRPVFSSPAQRVMVALDVDTLDDAERIAEELKGLGVTLKIGNQLGTWEGWKKAVDFSERHKTRIFCDTKFKDIPNTVRESSYSMTKHAPDFFNVMADTQIAALEAAVKGVDEAVRDFALSRPCLLGVTVLTTITSDECVAIYGADTNTKVLEFARNAATTGLDGVVCSAQEAAILRNDPVTKDLLLVTPGIRPEWAASGDQKRITTPRQAVEMGADYLVVGRPIPQPPAEVGSPRDAVLKIIEELS